MSKKMPAAPKSVEILKNAFASGNLFLVVGCGISSASVSNVREFIDEFLDHLNEQSGYVYNKILGQGENSFREKILKKQFEYFLQHVNEIINDNKLFKILQTNYPHKYTPELKKYLSRAHISIANAMKNNGVKVLTTNFDGFIEVAFNPSDVDACQVAINDMDFDNYQDAVNNYNYFKLHGSTEDEHENLAVATLFAEGGGFSKSKKDFLKHLFEAKKMIQRRYGFMVMV